MEIFSDIIVFFGGNTQQFYKNKNKTYFIESTNVKYRI